MSNMIRRINRLASCGNQSVRGFLLASIYRTFEKISYRCGVIEVTKIGDESTYDEDDTDDYEKVYYINVVAFDKTYYLKCKIAVFFGSFTSQVPLMDANSLNTLDNVLKEVESYASNFFDVHEKRNDGDQFNIKLVPASSVTVGMKVLQNVGDANGLLASREVANTKLGVDSVTLWFVGWTVPSSVQKSTMLCVLVDNQ